MELCVCCLNSSVSDGGDFAFLTMELLSVLSDTGDRLPFISIPFWFVVMLFLSSIEILRRLLEHPNSFSLSRCACGSRHTMQPFLILYSRGVDVEKPSCGFVATELIIGIVDWDTVFHVGLSLRN